MHGVFFLSASPSLRLSFFPILSFTRLTKTLAATAAVNQFDETSNNENEAKILPVTAVWIMAKIAAQSHVIVW